MSTDESIAVEAAFISANAASYIASTYTANLKGKKPPALTLERSCLRSLNAFLDYFLAIIIKDARSIALQDLKATLARVLDSALGYVALNEAQAELETYRNQETGAGRSFDHAPSSVATEDFNVEAIWLQARIRCMIYSTVGEKEETDFPSLSNDGEIAVTPPVAIFLTAILEFLGEHILLTSARFARERIAASTAGYLMEEDLDRGIKMDKALGTIWQSYLTIIPRTSEVLRKRASYETDGSTTERIFSTLPFSSTTTTKQEGHEQSQASQLRNMDQYEQYSDPTETPVLLRKASPSFATLQSGPTDPETLYSVQETAPLQTYTSTADHSHDPEILHTIPESTSPALDDRHLEANSSANGLNEASAFINGNAESSDDHSITVAGRGHMPLSGSTNLLENTETPSGASSIYGGPIESTKVEPPLVSSGLWSRKGGMLSENAPGISSRSLWSRPDSSERQDSSRTSVNAESSTTTGNSQGFESGLFQWNANRDTSSPATTPKKPIANGVVTDSSTTRSPFRDLYETVYAEQVKLSPTIPQGVGASTDEQVEKTEQKSGVTGITPSSNNGSISSGLVAPRKSIGTSLVKPKASMLSPVRDTFDYQARQGLGLRQMPEAEPGSDYELFLRSEMAREKDTRPKTTDAEAQRARILANRTAALQLSEKTSGQTEEVRGLKTKPVLQLSTPPAGTVNDTLARRVSNPAQPRSPTHTQSSQTTRLAEFLRSTGPQRITPKAVPLMSVAATRSTEASPTKTKPDEIFSRPLKLTKAESRIPLDSSAEEGDDGEESWDESLYGPRPRVERGESMTDFLKNVEPPATAATSKRRKSSRPEKVEPLSEQGKSRATANNMDDLDQDDELIAGPAYTSPKTSSTQFKQPTSPRSPKARQVPLSPTDNTAKTVLGRPLEPTTTEAARKNSLRKKSLVQDQRAVSRTLPQSEDETEESISDDDSIYGHPRRKPVQKESLADFLKNSSPPGYSSSRNVNNNGARVDGVGQSLTSSSSSSKPISRITKRISSLSVLVGGVGGTRRSGPESPPTSASPQRPNHRPLLP